VGVVGVLNPSPPESIESFLRYSLWEKHFAEKIRLLRGGPSYKTLSEHFGGETPLLTLGRASCGKTRRCMRCGF